MRAGDGKRVTIAFVCKLKDGQVYNLADRDMLEFVIGEGEVFPSLESGVIGMRSGDHRVILVPATEVEKEPFDPADAVTEASFPAGLGSTPTGYRVPAGSGAGVPLHPEREPLPPESELLFEVDMMQVEDAGRETLGISDKSKDDLKRFGP